MPKRARTLLRKRGATVAARNRTDGSEPPTRPELYAEGKRRHVRAGPAWTGKNSRALSDQ